MSLCITRGVQVVTAAPTFSGGRPPAVQGFHIREDIFLGEASFLLALLLLPRPAFAFVVAVHAVRHRGEEKGAHGERDVQEDVGRLIFFIGFLLAERVGGIYEVFV